MFDHRRVSEGAAIHFFGGITGNMWRREDAPTLKTCVFTERVPLGIAPVDGLKKYSGNLLRQAMAEGKHYKNIVVREAGRNEDSVTLEVEVEYAAIA